MHPFVPLDASSVFAAWQLPSQYVPLVVAGFVLFAYLCGSIPFGVLVARARGVDIRQHGSGNIGATNVARTCGKRFGLLVFALDFLKGFFPVLLARLLATLSESAFVKHELPVLAGLAAILGHVFPVWLSFRGGKAGATGLGVGAVLCWPAMLVAAIVWIVTVLATRYVSLGTMLGSMSYVAAYLVQASIDGTPLDRVHRTMTVFSIAVTLLIVIRHKENIKRLIAGTESRVGRSASSSGDPITPGDHHG